MTPGLASSETLALVEDATAAFLRDRHSLNRLRQGSGATLWPEIVDLGLAACLLPEADGGADIGALGAVRVSRLLGRALLPEPIVELAFMPSVLVRALPPNAIREQIAAGLTHSGTTTAMAWQTQGSEADAWANTCQYADGRLTGQKAFAPHADLHLVTACKGEEIALVAVRLPAPPADSGHAVDLLGVASCTQVFPDIAAEPLLTGPEAAGAVEQALDTGVLATSALLLGAAESLFDVTLDHLRTRRQFGRPLGAFQALQHRAADLAMSIATLEAMLENAATILDLDPTSAQARAAVSAARVKACLLSADITREAVQMHGAIGFTEEADVGLYLRGAMVWAARFGGALPYRRRFMAAGGDQHG